MTTVDCPWCNEPALVTAVTVECAACNVTVEIATAWQELVLAA